MESEEVQALKTSLALAEMDTKRFRESRDRALAVNTVLQRQIEDQDEERDERLDDERRTYRATLQVLEDKEKSLLGQMRALQKRDLGYRRADSALRELLDAAHHPDSPLSPAAVVSQLVEIYRSLPPDSPAAEIPAGRVEVRPLRGGHVLSILAGVGARILPGQPLLELESQQGSFAVESPGRGIVVDLLAAPGDAVTAETPLLTLEMS